MTTTKIALEAVNSICSRWYEWRNSTVIWEPIGGDDELNFNRKYNAAIRKSNLPRFVEEMKMYKKHPVTYKINNYGFRGADDFNSKDEYTVFLGCSHTAGIGHYYENTWAYQMLNWLDDGSKMANLSNGGNGIPSGYRYLLKFKDIIKIKRIFLFYPHWFRYEFNQHAGQYRIITPHDGEHYDPTREWGKQGWFELSNYLLSFNHCWHHYNSHALAIYSIAQELGVPLYFSSYYDNRFREKPEHTNIFYARDMHSSTWIYNSVFKMFQNKVINGEEADFNYIQENMFTRKSQGDESLMDANNQGILLNPPFTTPEFALPNNYKNPHQEEPPTPPMTLI